MKKSTIIFLSVLAMSLTFSGCGESEGSVSSGVDNPSNVVSGSVDTITDPVVLGNGDTSDTVADTPYNLALALGTPPGVPSN